MQWSMEIWRSEWETTLQMQPLKTRVWRAIYRNKNRFCGFYVGGENKRECAETCAPDSVCTDLKFAYEDELGMNIVSKADMFGGEF